ncbi:Hypothetical predicted protein [Olea europaea subsp. europaea]|uniref:Uncharacterized protein n=1 Tax=Olea europaea subsp. europaea TaxID=158383 RepID=A0A8S0T0H5_OLEEU|nr:Hypothetical predicted protein [Olea europaea subsp. europaea]
MADSLVCSWMDNTKIVSKIRISKNPTTIFGSKEMTSNMIEMMNRKRINDIKLDELELPSSDKLLSNVRPKRMADIIFLNSPLIET